MSSFARLLQQLPASRRPYSSFFSKPGGGRYFNSHKPATTTKAVAVARANRATVDAPSPDVIAASEAAAKAPEAPTPHPDAPTHPLIGRKDFVLQSFFALHRPLLHLDDPAAVFRPAPPFGQQQQDGPAERAMRGEDSVADVDADADTARQLTRALTMHTLGAQADWNVVLQRLGLPVEEDEIAMDSTKRKRKKKMKKHK
ncbi:hypothetical protein BD626DRAFT_497553 [Schizophyllum amplum]|uniref:Mitochondrial mRNA-processing protein COX24 C-terminal domain-containing protein n=1 Tax=Schizophyllum amplum TaxID=97359 RepID=A0A550CCR9_9AGAR|nr:hypothetical protein BD626DRAFT_497553 [Auriculariopsis ampla]